MPHRKLNESFLTVILLTNYYSRYKEIVFLSPRWLRTISYFHIE